MIADLASFDPAGEVDGAALLDEVAGTLAAYVAFPSPAAGDAAALWAAHTHALAAFDSTPRLALLSPEPQSGKTRTLEVLDLLVVAPLSVANTTVAVLARTVDAEPTTVLLDECDAVFGSRAQEHEDLRAILNAGHRRGASYARMVGEGAGMQAKRFAIFAPVALAGIGDLPETVMQRSVVIRMRRRAPGEQVAPFRFRDARAECEPLRDALGAWCAARLDSLADARPVMPPGITDRPADVWEPLLAIADAAGGSWPERAREACVELVAAATSTDGGSLGVRLLADLRTGFGAAEALHTETVLDALHCLDESPWADLRGKPLDARGLARRLRAYGVRSVDVKIDGINRKGYRREHLYDTWNRYLPTLSEKSATCATSATPQVSASSEVADAAEVALVSATRPASATDDHASDLRGSAGSAGSAPAGEGPLRGGVPGIGVRPARAVLGYLTARGLDTFPIEDEHTRCDFMAWIAADPARASTWAELRAAFDLPDDALLDSITWQDEVPVPLEMAS